MRDALSGLALNLLAGARVALFARVDRAAFRVDLVQWLAIVVVSALIDVALDGLRAGPDASFSLAGIDGELFALGLLVFTSALIAALYRDAGVFVALPVVVLAAFPVLQVIHALPAIVQVDFPAGASTAFELVVFAWMVWVCVRAVYIVADSAGPQRRTRAVIGGLLLSLPLWFAPLAGPLGGWWTTDTDDEASADAPNAASEAVMAVQTYLLDHALDDLEDERSGVTDLYFVGFAPDSRQDGFHAELEMAQHVMDEHFDTRGRSITLLNHRDTLTEVPFATLTNLRRVLDEIGEAIDPDDDVVMLYLTGAPDDDGGLAAVQPPLDLVPVSPEAVKQLLDSAGIRFRVIVVSTCAAGAWMDAFQDDDTAVLVSSPGTTRAPGCEGAAQPSPFSSALFDRALANADSIPTALAALAHDAAGPGGVAPRLRMGRGVAAQLERVDRGPALHTAALR